MGIWAISDLHLSLGVGVNKPMDIFGPEWEDHLERIKIGWINKVQEEDLVIIPGDISWAMRMEEAREDLYFIAALPGSKLILRGNHDYWWNSVSKVRAALPPGVYALQNDHFAWEGWAISGTRGWVCPGEARFDPLQDEKIYHREVARLELSLESALNGGFKRIMAVLHYPPFNMQRDGSGFTRLMAEYGVEICIYGHLHAEAKNSAFEGFMGNTEYKFVSADKLGFVPLRIS